MMWGYGGDSWGWIWGAAMMAVFGGGIIFFAFWVIRSVSGPRRTADTAIDTLNRRFASGEINQEEFEKTKKALGA